MSRLAALAIAIFSLPAALAASAPVQPDRTQRLNNPDTVPDGLTAPDWSSIREQFERTSGATFTIVATTNLLLPVSNWTVLGPATNIAPGQFQFTDLQAASNPLRFYRVRSP
jgi:hypothetical protein